VTWVVDTSAWIELWLKYPPQPFQSIWQKLAALVAAGELCSPDQVDVDLVAYAGDQALRNQLLSIAGLFRPLDAPVQNAMNVVVAACPGLASPGSTKSRSDPFVVAQALADGSTVVTMERAMRPPETRPRIPDACKGVGVGSVSVLGFIGALGLTL
jgi:hypothetical protein